MTTEARRIHAEKIQGKTPRHYPRSSQKILWENRDRILEKARKKWHENKEVYNQRQRERYYRYKEEEFRKILNKWKQSVIHYSVSTKITPANCFEFETYVRASLSTFASTGLFIRVWTNVLNIDRESYNSPYRMIFDWLASETQTAIVIQDDAPLCKAMLGDLKPYFHTITLIGVTLTSFAVIRTQSGRTRRLRQLLSGLAKTGLPTALQTP